MFRLFRLKKELYKNSLVTIKKVCLKPEQPVHSFLLKSSKNNKGDYFMNLNTYKNIINQRFSIIDIIKNYITNKFEEKQIGDSIRLHPCPFTNNEHNSFSLKRYDNGFEVYYMFNTEFIDKRFKDIPESGTAYDMLKGLFPDLTEIELLFKLKPGKAQIKYRNTLKPKQSKKLEFVSQEELNLLQNNYTQQMLDYPECLNYLIDVRKFNLETIDHFKIGYDHEKKVYTYPCIINNQIKHFRYKNKDKAYHLKNNSGGYWFFNEDTLKDDDIMFVEGEHDVMMIWQECDGFNAVAICGKITDKTSKFQKIKDLKNKRIYLAFDNDEQGKKYTEFFKGYFSQNNEVTILNYKGKDPDECLKNGYNLV